MHQLARLTSSDPALSHPARSRAAPARSGPSRASRRRHVAEAAAAAAIASATIVTPATAADTYAQTRYPVVLVHGLFGFDQVGAADYFYAIPKALRDGGATVFTPAVSAANSNEVRGEQLLQTLLSLKATYGYSKFNLIGHSQGGETARYVAAVAPQLVASVTTVGTPHFGSKLADALGSVTSVPLLGPTLVSLVNGFASVISFITGSSALPQDALGALQSLNSAGAAQFNKTYPQGAPTSNCGAGPAKVNGVSYYSVGGTAVLSNPFDISDAVLALGALSYGTEPSDGVVGKCSSHWGTVLKDNYSWNHIDEVNQIFGLRGLFSQDPVAFYRSQANRLKSSGM